MFAAATAERLRPAYNRFHKRTNQGNVAMLAEAMSALWSSIMGEPEDLESQLTLLDELSIGEEEEEDWVAETGLAENAVSGVGCSTTSRCRGVDRCS